MAGWSMLANGTGLDSDIVNHKQKGILQTNDVDVVNRCDDDDDVELRSLFDQALSVCHTLDNGSVRVKPVQASVGNGETVDLFKLFCVVGERGGFDLVDGFWNCVAKELGLDPVLSGSVKLVYFRYLYSMERWLIRSFSDEQLGHHSERKRKGSDFSRDLETKLRGLLGDGKTGKKARVAVSECEERGNTVGLDSGKCELGLLGKMNPCRPANGFHIRNNDDDDENINGGCGNYGDIAVDQEMTQNDLGEKKSRKRKRISVSKLLRWIRQAAVCPIDHAAVSTSYDKRGNDLKALAIRARDFLVGETGFDLNVGQRSSKDQEKMNLSKSEDINTSQAVEKLRCSERLPALQQSRSRSVPNGNAKDITSRTNGVVDSPLTKGTTPLKHDHIPVRIHSRYQVRVPKWTGEVCESDDKWLGTKVWPLEDAADTSKQVSVMMSRIGKGRPAFCRCQIPGSVSCVRFHTAERRMKLKLELGSAFFRCGFHHMGEEISLRWTPEEEQSFKEMVSRNRPSQERCFWDYAHQFLPGRPRRELVSYYFNVFQLQRRSYQNRATPDDIDSDDDQKEFGSFSSGYGHHAIEVRQMNEEVCSLNKQLTDYP